MCGKRQRNSAPAKGDDSSQSSDDMPFTTNSGWSRNELNSQETAQTTPLRVPDAAQHQHHQQQQQQHQSVDLTSYLNTGDDALLMPSGDAMLTTLGGISMAPPIGIPAGNPPLLLGFYPEMAGGDQRQDRHQSMAMPPGGTSFPGSMAGPSLQWDGLGVGSLFQPSQASLTTSPNPAPPGLSMPEPPVGWPPASANVSQPAFPVPSMRRPPLAAPRQRRMFLVQTGDVKRVVIQCDRGSVNTCANFYLDHDYGLIDISLARELKLELIPLPPDMMRHPRESPQGIIKPNRYVELWLTGMEPIPGRLASARKQLRLCVFRSTMPFVKLTLGKVAARELGLEMTGTA